MKTRISNNEIITEADLVVNMLDKTIKIISDNETRMVSYRAPFHILAVIDAMANISGQSRNTLMNHLLQAGIDEVRERMDDEMVERLSIAEALTIDQLLASRPE